MTIGEGDKLKYKITGQGYTENPFNDRLQILPVKEQRRIDDSEKNLLGGDIK